MVPLKAHQVVDDHIKLLDEDGQIWFIDALFFFLLEIVNLCMGFHAPRWAFISIQSRIWHYMVHVFSPTGIQDTLQYDLPQKEKKVKRIEKGKS